MTFSTLEQKFSQISEQIYSRYAPSPDQLVVVKPNDKQLTGGISINNDTRLLPIVSTARDISRITKFITSPRGQLFVGKQLLLQTGNTFADTRLYNPASPIINAVPSLFLVRYFGNPIYNFRTPNREFRGAVQAETINTFTEGRGNYFVRQFKGILPSRRPPESVTYFDTPEGSPLAYYVRPEDNIFYRFKDGNTYKDMKTIKTPVPIPNITGKNLTIYGDQGYGPILSPVQPLKDRGNVNIFRDLSGISRIGSSQPNRLGGNPTIGIKFSNRWTDYALQTSSFQNQSNQNVPFKLLENKAFTNGYFNGKTFDVLDLTAQSVAGPTEIRDPFNIPPANSNDGISIYTSISGSRLDNLATEEDKKQDIIPFIFKIDGVDVQFRAFLSSLKEVVKPEFSEQRYLGRTERFVTYGGAKRTVNLSFNVVAFSLVERDSVWKRINFLTGLAYPIRPSTSGFMTPPLFRLTVGGIYANQPCYIDSLNYTFLDDSTIFDIDAGVPTVVDVDMSLVLLEKQSQYYDSPFYSIVGSN